ncbi:MAG: transposase [Burkholderiales bacterium]|nr:transposase [Burkholderiales bacterium]
MPAELRALAREHPRIVYNTLMDCAWRTLREFALNHRQLRGSPGALAVLHTHSRALELHPHVHLALPAAALDEPWVVDCKRLDHGDAAVVYLGHYLVRGVIQERDIVRMDDSGVTYRWCDSKTGRMRQRTVEGTEFLRLVLQHVLPKGLRRARSYGFLHPDARRLAALLKLLVFKVASAQSPPTERATLRCSCCGAPMRIVLRRTPPLRAAAPATSSSMSGPPPSGIGAAIGAQA